VAAGGCSQTPHWLIDVLLVTHTVDDTHCSEDVTPLFRFLVLIILMVNTCSLIVNSHLMFFPDDDVCTLDLQLSLMNLLYYSPKGVAAPLILTSSKKWEWVYKATTSMRVRDLTGLLICQLLICSVRRQQLYFLILRGDLWGWCFRWWSRSCTNIECVVVHGQSKGRPPSAF
jgi:hypothetical protein